MPHKDLHKLWQPTRFMISWRLKLKMPWQACEIIVNGVSPGWKSCSVLKNRARIFSPGKRAKNLEKSHVIETESRPGLKNMKKRCCHYEVEAISVKSDKMENLRNFKFQLEYENIETRLKSTRLSGKHKSASLRMYFLHMQMHLSGWEICSQRQVSFAFHHHCRLLNTIPKI